MNQELDKQIILAAIRRHLPAILISTVVGMLLAFMISNFMLDKQYESTAQVYISNVNEATIQKVTQSDLTAAKSMANTYRVIMPSPRAAQELRARLANDPEFDLDYLDAYKLTTSIVNDTEIIKISVKCGDPKMAALICNTMVDVSTNLISDIFEGGRCNSLGEATPEYRQCFPNVRNMMLIGALLGKNEEAETVIDGMKTTFESLKGVCGDGEKTIYFEVSPLEYGLWTAGANTFMNEIAELLGLKNCFADVEGWAEISEEQVLERNPDYIVTISMYYGEGPTPEEEIASRAGWDNLTAVKNGAILNLQNNELSRPAPRLAEGAQMLADFIAGVEANDKAA